MSEVKELQEEEKEALVSIYEGDNAFKQISDTVYQYKYGKEDDIKSVLLELTWGENYPNDIPSINLDMFYNRNIIQSIKDNILSIINEEAQQWIGCGMTYTLFECLKERFTELLEAQPDVLIEKIEKIDIQKDQIKVVKKEQLTKSQKRRIWDKSDHHGEKLRGYDWVDIVKHLSQTGGKDSTS